MIVKDKTSSVSIDREQNFCHNCRHFDYDESWDGEEERSICYCSEYCCLLDWHDIACNDYVETII